MSKIVKRSDKLAFFGVVDAENTVTYFRMKGFNEISTQKGPKEYSRQYVDQEFEQSDVVGYSPSISYSFDQFTDNAVHNDLVTIAEKELVGPEAIRSIVMVDLSRQTDNGAYPAVKRDFSVICDSEGDSMDAYTYSGALKVKGEKVFGTATSTDDWETCSFVEA
ncbi:MAG: hypothetical protein E7393_04845 [Ruminococcaceae bacterium]|nr:hypothetical protein [Oscillospiraceae bacterium]